MNTAKSLLLVDGEMLSIRVMVMQNRLALDVILAKEGGVCKVLKIHECCTYIPDNSKDLRRYISNITEIRREIRSLTEGGGEGLLGEIGKGFGVVGSWFASQGRGILGYVLKPLIITIVCVIIIWGLFRTFKWYRASRAERQLRQREARLERLQDSQYRSLQNLERFHQRRGEMTTSV